MNRLEQIEQAVVTLAGRVGPLLSPVPTAYLVGAATIEYLSWPQPVAVVAALTIECLGLASTGLVLELYDYNKRKLASEPKAPAKLAGVLVGAYFVVATGLTVALDILPDLARFAPAIFPALSLTGVSILAIRSDHRQRVAGNVQAKVGRAEKRASRRVSKKTPNGVQDVQMSASKLGQLLTEFEQKNVQKKSPEWATLRQLIWMRDEKRCLKCGKTVESDYHCHHIEPESVGGEGKPSNLSIVCGRCHMQIHDGGKTLHSAAVYKKGKVLDRMLDVYLDNPGIGATALSGQLGVSRSSIYNYTAELIDTGRAKKNGNGIEVLG